MLLHCTDISLDIDNLRHLSKSLICSNRASVKRKIDTDGRFDNVFQRETRISTREM